MRFLILLLFITFFNTIDAQSKIEIEKRISESDVPVKALNYIKTTFPEKKVEWYLEQNELTKTYEAKFCIEKLKHSVEFSNNGDLEHLEIIISYKSIIQTTKTTINTKLDLDFLKYRILNIQKHYIKGLKDEKHTNYVIVLLGKDKDAKGSYKYRFNYNGELLNKLQIEDPNFIYLQN